MEFTCTLLLLGEGGVYKQAQAVHFLDIPYAVRLDVHIRFAETAFSNSGSVTTLAQGRQTTPQQFLAQGR